MTGATGDAEVLATVEGSSINVPNGLTGLRLAAVPAFGWMLLSHPDSTAWRLATTGVFVVASVTDSIDGYLARRHNLVTRFGKLADPIADKALTGMALVGLSVTGQVPWWITVAILGRELGVTLLRFLVLRYAVISANRGGKIKAWLQSVATGLYLLPLPAATDPYRLAIMLVALAVTLGTGIDYVGQAWRLWRSSVRRA